MTKQFNNKKKVTKMTKQFNLSPYSDYSDTDFKDKDLRDQDARSSDFSNCKLALANVKGANFQGCNFTGADVTEEDLIANGAGDVRWCIFDKAKTKKDDFDYSAELEFAKKNKLFEGRSPKKDDLKKLVKDFRANGNK